MRKKSIYGKYVQLSINYACAAVAATQASTSFSNLSDCVLLAL
jgi:hypothetical protein